MSGVPAEGAALAKAREGDTFAGQLAALVQDRERMVKTFMANPRALFQMLTQASEALAAWATVDQAVEALAGPKDHDFDSLLLLIDAELEGVDVQNTDRRGKLLHAARVNIRNALAGFSAASTPQPEPAAGGWVTVPAKPTEAMIVACESALDEWRKTLDSDARILRSRIQDGRMLISAAPREKHAIRWAAMIAASPSPPGLDEGGVEAGALAFETSLLGELGARIEWNRPGAKERRIEAMRAAVAAITAWEATHGH